MCCRGVPASVLVLGGDPLVDPLGDGRSDLWNH